MLSDLKTTNYKSLGSAESLNDQDVEMNKFGIGSGELTVDKSSYFFDWNYFRMSTAEFVGTFFLTFFVSATKITTSIGAAPYAIAVGLIALIYATAHVSGGQMNPAVTLALLSRNKINRKEAYYCWIAQISGAILAGLICYAMYSNKWDQIGYPSVTNHGRQLPAFFGEMIQTFALVSVCLNTATTKAQDSNSYFGLAIGFVVLAGALVIGNITGACFNPALSVLTMMHGDWTDLWVFIFGPFVGALLASGVFRLTNPEECDPSIDPLFSCVRLFAPSYHHNAQNGMIRNIAKLTQEFIGTFFLSYTVAMTSNASSSAAAFVAVGAILTAMVYSGGAISGGQYNPCVTLGVYLRGVLVKCKASMPLSDALCYVVVQIAASFVGGLGAAYVNGGFEWIAAPRINLLEHSDIGAMFAEFLFSYLLVLTVLCTATSSRVAGNSYFGLAIGLVVVSGGVTVGDFSGGCFNPAIAIALPLLKSQSINSIALYVVSELTGGMAAAVTFAFWHHGVINGYSEI